MSTFYFAAPDALLGWLKKLAADYRVLAPRKEGRSVMFRPHTADELTDMDELLRRATASPKGAAIPHSETLVRFTSTKDAEDPARLNTSLEAPCGDVPTLLFGGRPCDARGFVVLDRPYLEGTFKDPYYAARRDALVIVSQACPTAFATCFCHWVGGSPAGREGSDILFTTVDGGFVLESVTEKGAKLLETAGFASGEDKKDEADAAHRKAEASLGAPSTLENIPARVAARFRDEAFWIKETEKCLSCGACTYLCPTCQCFTITDEGSQLDGRRIRSWDSCMSPLFTLETSGHNPRAEKFKRMRNRISHKFSYYPQSYNGEYSCVGCGRCVVSCPVSLDIRQVVKHAVEGAPEIAQEAASKPAKPAPGAEAPKPAPARVKASAAASEPASPVEEPKEAPKAEAAPKAPAKSEARPKTGGKPKSGKKSR